MATRHLTVPGPRFGCRPSGPRRSTAVGDLADPIPAGPAVSATFSRISLLSRTGCKPWGRPTWSSPGPIRDTPEESSGRSRIKPGADHLRSRRGSIPIPPNRCRRRRHHRSQRQPGGGEAGRSTPRGQETGCTGAASDEGLTTVDQCRVEEVERRSATPTKSWRRSSRAAGARTSEPYGDTKVNLGRI